MPLSPATPLLNQFCCCENKLCAGLPPSPEKCGEERRAPACQDRPALNKLPHEGFSVTSSLCLKGCKEASYGRPCFFRRVFSYMISSVTRKVP